MCVYIYDLFFKTSKRHWRSIKNRQRLERFFHLRKSLNSCGNEWLELKQKSEWWNLEAMVCILVNYLQHRCPTSELYVQVNKRQWLQSWKRWLLPIANLHGLIHLSNKLRSVWYIQWGELSSVLEISGERVHEFEYKSIEFFQSEK